MGKALVDTCTIIFCEFFFIVIMSYVLELAVKCVVVTGSVASFLRFPSSSAATEPRIPPAGERLPPLQNECNVKCPSSSDCWLTIRPLAAPFVSSLLASCPTASSVLSSIGFVPSTSLSNICCPWVSLVVMPQTGPNTTKQFLVEPCWILLRVVTGPTGRSRRQPSLPSFHCGLKNFVVLVFKVCQISTMLSLAQE